MYELSHLISQQQCQWIVCKRLENCVPASIKRSCDYLYIFTSTNYAAKAMANQIGGGNAALRDDNDSRQGPREPKVLSKEVERSRICVKCKCV
jgi:hypothetical protein